MSLLLGTVRNIGKKIPKTLPSTSHYQTHLDIEGSPWTAYVDENTPVNSPMIDVSGYDTLYISLLGLGTGEDITTEMRIMGNFYGNLGFHLGRKPLEMINEDGSIIGEILTFDNDVNYIQADVAGLNEVYLQYKSLQEHTSSNHIRIKIRLSSQSIRKDIVKKADIINNNITGVRSDIAAVSEEIAAQSKPNFVVDLSNHFASKEVIETVPSGYVGLRAILAHKIEKHIPQASISKFRYAKFISAEYGYLISSYEGIMRMDIKGEVLNSENVSGPGFYQKDGYFIKSGGLLLNKYNMDFTIEWSTALNAPTNAVYIDDNNFIYAGTDPYQNEGQLVKLDPDGNIIWIYKGFGNQRCSAVTVKEGIVYAGGFDEKVHCINENLPAASVVNKELQGALVWYVDTNLKEGNVKNIIIDDNDIFYLSGHGSVIRKIDPVEWNVISGELQGTPIWEFSGHNSRVMGLDIDRAGNLYTASHDGTAKKISPEGVELWSFNEFLSSDLGPLCVHAHNGLILLASWSGEIFIISDSLKIKGFLNQG